MVEHLSHKYIQLKLHDSFPQGGASREKGELVNSKKEQQMEELQLRDPDTGGNIASTDIPVTYTRPLPVARTKILHTLSADLDVPTPNPFTAPPAKVAISAPSPIITQPTKAKGPPAEKKPRGVCTFGRDKEDGAKPMNCDEKRKLSLDINKLQGNYGICNRDRAKSVKMQKIENLRGSCTLFDYV